MEKEGNEIYPQVLRKAQNSWKGKTFYLVSLRIRPESSTFGI